MLGLLKSDRSAVQAIILWILCSHAVFLSSLYILISGRFFEIPLENVPIPPHIIWASFFSLVSYLFFRLYSLSTFAEGRTSVYFSVSPLWAAYIFALVMLGSQVGLGEALPISERLGIVVFAFIEQAMFFSPALFVLGFKRQILMSVWLLMLFIPFHRIDFSLFVAVVLLLPGWAHALFCKNIWLSVGLHSALNLSVFSLSAFPNSDYVVFPFAMYFIGAIYALFDVFKSRKMQKHSAGKMSGFSKL